MPAPTSNSVTDTALADSLNLSIQCPIIRSASVMGIELPSIVRSNVKAEEDQKLKITLLWNNELQAIAMRKGLDKFPDITVVNSDHPRARNFQRELRITPEELIELLPPLPPDAHIVLQTNKSSHQENELDILVKSQKNELLFRLNLSAESSNAQGAEKGTVFLQPGGIYQKLKTEWQNMNIPEITLEDYFDKVAKHLAKSGFKKLIIADVGSMSHLPPKFKAEGSWIFRELNNTIVGKDIVKSTIFYIVNFLAGTWHVGSGMPKLDTPFGKAIYNSMLFTGKFKAVAFFRAVGMKALAFIKDYNHKEKQSEIKLYDNLGIPHAYDPNQRSFFFPGSGIAEVRNKLVGIRDLNTYCNAMGDVSVNTSIYLYKETPGAWFNRLGEAYLQSALPNHYGKEAREFCDAVLLPRVAKTVKNDNGKNKGEGTLDSETLAKNLTLVMGGQSYGGTFIIQVINALTDSMQQMGYKDREIQAGIKNIFVFSISGAIPIEPTKFSPTIKSIEDVNDFVILQMPRHSWYPNKIDLEKIRKDRMPISYQVSPEREFCWVSNKVPGDVYFDLYGEHDMRITFREGNIPANILESWSGALRRIL